MPPSPFDDDWALLSPTLDDVFSSDITYSRGESSLAIRASSGRTEYTVAASDGSVRTQWTDRDFLVRSADLGDLGPPRKADRIVVDGETYEVLPLDGQQCFRRCDPSGVMLRIHAKRVGSNSP